MAERLQADVGTPCLEYMRMAQSWDMIEALLGGTRAMRARGRTYLPKHPNETDANYAIRLSRSTLTNYFRATIRHLGGKAFAKPLALGDDIPPQIVEWIEDIDLSGQHLSVFASSLFQHGLAYGKGYILVDHPRVPPGLTLDEERKLHVRPYFVFIPCQNVIEIKWSDDGLTMLRARIRETVTVPDGEWGEKEVVRVRVLVPGGYALYEQVRGESGKIEWILLEQGPMSIGEIPLVEFFANRPESRFVTTPPLEDLAYLNVAHWQSASDQRNVLTVARYPILAASGWDANDPDITVGPQQLLKTENPNGKFYYVEHSGSAIAAGRQDLEDLKAEMAMMGLQMLAPQATGTGVTATASQIRYVESTSALRMMADNLTDALENALLLMAKWVGLPDGGSVTLQGNFELDRDEASDVQNLLNLRVAGEISRATLWKALVKRKLLPEDFDEEREALQIASENDQVGLLG